MRLSLKAPYKSSAGNGSVIYERTYPVGGGMPLWCGLSAIFYGGVCWAYLAMPFGHQQETLVQDATSELNAKIGAQDSVILGPRIERISWGSAESYLEVTPEVAPAL